MTIPVSQHHRAREILNHIRAKSRQEGAESQEQFDRWASHWTAVVKFPLAYGVFDPSYDPEIAEVQEWLEENCGDAWKQRSFPGLGDYFGFAKESAATLFKLRWC